LSIGEIRETRSDLDVTVESEATRRQIRLEAPMTLTDETTGEVVMARTLIAISSYDVIGSQFTTLVGEDDAREAALNDIARQIETQVSLYFRK